MTVNSKFLQMNVLRLSILIDASGGWDTQGFLNIKSSVN